LLSSDARAPLDGVSDRERYLQSLELIRGLEFDLLIRSLATAGQPYHETSTATRRGAGSRRYRARASRRKWLNRRSRCVPVSGPPDRAVAGLVHVARPRRVWRGTVVAATVPRRPLWPRTRIPRGARIAAPSGPSRSSQRSRVARRGRSGPPLEERSASSSAASCPAYRRCQCG
jgi:hypothetical protein